MLSVRSLFALLFAASFISCPSFAEENVVSDKVQQLEEGIKELKASAQKLSAEHDQLTSENMFLRSSIVDLEHAVENAKTANAELSKQPVEAKKAIEAENAKVNSFKKPLLDVQKNIDSLSGKKTELLSKDQRLSERLKPLEAQKGDLTKQKSDLAAALDQLKGNTQTQRDTLAKDISDLRGRYSEIENKRQEALKAVAAQGHSQGGTSPAIEKLSKENKSLMSEIEKIQKAHTTATAKSSHEGSNVEMELAKIKSQTAVLQNQNGDLTNHLTQLKEKAAQNSAPSESQNQIEALKQGNNALKVQEGDLKNSLASLKRDNAIIDDLLTAKKTSSAEHLLVKAPDNSPQALESMAYAYASSGDYSAAVQYYQKTLQKSTKKKNIYFNLGYLYFQMGNIPEAIESYKHVLRIDPSDREAKSNVQALQQGTQSLRLK